MFSIRKPSDVVIETFLRRANSMDFSYREIGRTRGDLPEGYRVDHNRVILGHGIETFRKAVSALRSWKMFSLGWVCLFRPSTPVKSGSTVVVVVRHFGFWSLHANRVIYLIEEDRRFGFAYGTLSEHAERGEERFFVEWDHREDSVYYDILAFSTPQQWPVRIAWPLARMLQRKFARDSMSAMKRAVSAPTV
jgi:uncharacterized protein (UPF0548 family)